MKENNKVSSGNTKKSKTKSIILGISIIVAAIAGALKVYLDEDPNTTVDFEKTITEITQGIEEIKNSEFIDNEQVNNNAE